MQQRAPLYGKVGTALRDLGWIRRKRRRKPGADQEWAYVRGSEHYRISAYRSHGDLIITNLVAGAEDDTEEEETDLSLVEMPDLSGDL